MKLFWSICLCALALPSYCLSEDSQDQIDDDVASHFLYPKDRKGNPNTRIIGGREVTPHAYPFQAALYIYYPNARFFCGGTLITPQFVLTAAHCVDDHPSFVLVQLGAHNISKDESQTVVLNATRYIVHERWNKAALQNDVALIKLPRNVTLDQNVNVVRLANGSNTYANRSATIVGWGETEILDMSYVLRYVNSTVLSNDECAATGKTFKDILVPSHICSSGRGIVGSCSGDSGGPLLVDGVQVGIVSFGTEICTLGNPSVFTRVTSFNDWIVKRLADSSCGRVNGSVAILLGLLLMRFFY